MRHDDAPVVANETTVPSFRVQFLDWLPETREADIQIDSLYKDGESETVVVRVKRYDVLNFVGANFYVDFDPNGYGLDEPRLWLDIEDE